MSGAAQCIEKSKLRVLQDSPGHEDGQNWMMGLLTVHGSEVSLVVWGSMPEPEGGVGTWGVRHSPACVGLTPDSVEIDHPQSHRRLLPVLEGKGGSHVNVFLQSKSQASGGWGFPSRESYTPNCSKPLVYSLSQRTTQPRVGLSPVPGTSDGKLTWRQEREINGCLKASQVGVM